VKTTENQGRAKKKNQAPLKPKTTRPKLKKRAKKTKRPKSISCPAGTNNKVTYCTYDEKNGKFQTKEKKGKKGRNRSSEIKAPGYCGECIGENFIRNAVLIDLPKEIGSEKSNGFDIDYEYTFAEDGIVSLASVHESILAVTCSAEQVEIQFSGSVDPSDLSLMFPQDAVLVVDGAFFGIDCRVGSPSHPDQNTFPDSAFLVIQSKAISPSNDAQVIVSGVAGSFNDLFQEKKLSYVASQERCNLAEVPIPIPTIIGTVPPDDFPIKAKIEAKPTVITGILLYKVSWFKSWGPLETPWIDIQLECSFQADITAKTTITIDGSKIPLDTPLKDILEKKGEFDFPFSKIPVPSLALKLPGVQALKKFLSKIPDEVGVFVYVPFYLEMKVKVDFAKIFTLTNTASTGKKRFLIGWTGMPPIILFPTFKVLEDATPTKQESSIVGLDNFQESESLAINVNMFAGLRPSILLDFLGKLINTMLLETLTKNDHDLSL
jgi:hypothetical protein